MFDWLSKIGDTFNSLSSPIDFLLGFIVQSATEGVNFALGNLFKLMTLSSSFNNILAIREMRNMVLYLVGTMVGGVATWHIFNNLLKMAVGQEAKTFHAIIGDFISFAFRLLSMPFFLFTALAINEVMIDAIQINGVNTKKMQDYFGVAKSDSGAFLERISKLFEVTNTMTIIAPIIVFALLIVFLVLLFQLIKRSGEVIFLYLLMPMVALSSLTSDLDMYSTWWRQCLSIIGGQTLQAIGVYLSFSCFISNNGILGTGILLATISTPQVVKEYAYNSGATGGLRNFAGGMMLMGRGGAK